MFLLQDNVPIHTAQITVAETANCAFELLPHPPYSPDIALPDFLFPKLKSHLHSHHFGNNDEIICAVEFLEYQNTTTFSDWTAMIKHCWTKWIDVKNFLNDPCIYNCIYNS